MAYKFLTIPQYQKESGLSRKTIMKMIESGELIAVQTDGGQQRIKVDIHPEIVAMRAEMEQMRGLLDNLCTHLGVR
jgi:excisionase family DNA binding protein